jgi:CRISPR system Cascade subunit CasD
MGRPILLLRLEGPLQAWGVRSRWDVRDTGPEPTKSGIVGLLGCALGYPMGDSRLETELDAGLRFGVRIEAAGHLMIDFQTITDFLPMADGRHKFSGGGKALAKLRDDPDAEPATIISPRSYLEDAAFLVALDETGVTPGVLTRCAHALRHPVWPLYLGRKACIPTRPIFDALLEEYRNLEDALCRHPWSWLGAGQENRLASSLPATLTAYVEDRDGSLTRQDAVRINPARQYSFRHAHKLEAIDISILGKGGA